MISGIARMAASMGAYAASKIVTKSALRVGSSLLRTGISKTTQSRFMSNAPNALKGLVKPIQGVARATSTLIGKSPGSGAISKTLQQADRHIKQKISPGRNTKIYEALKLNTKEELFHIPANYGMYKVAKSKATTEQEVEQTSSFRRWYVGAPMVSSIVASSAFSFAPGVAKGAFNKVTRKINQPTRENITRGALKTGEWFSNQIRNVEHWNQSRKTMSRTPQGIIGRIKQRGVKDVFSKLAHDKIHRDRRYRYRSGMSTIYHRLDDDNIMRKTMENVQNFKKTIQSKNIDPKYLDISEQNAAFLRQTSDAITKPKNKTNSSSDFTARLLNRINKEDEVKNVKLELKQSEANVYKIDIKKLNSDLKTDDGKFLLTKGYGHYTYKNREYDLSKFNLTYAGDKIKELATSGPFKKITSMYGLAERIDLSKSYNRLSTEFTHGQQLLQFGTNLINPNSGKPHSAQNIIKKAIQAVPSNSKYDDNITDVVNTLENKFKNNASSIYGIDSKENILEDIMKLGQLPLSKNDIVVTHADGISRALVQIGIDTTSKVPEYIPIDLNAMLPDSQKIAKMTVNTSSSTKSIARYVGNSTITVGNEHKKLGPQINNQIDRNNNYQGFFGKIRDKLDIGYGEDLGLGSKVRRIFTKWTDNSNERVFIGNLYRNGDGFLRGTSSLGDRSELQIKNTIYSNYSKGHTIVNDIYENDLMRIVKKGDKIYNKNEYTILAGDSTETAKSKLKTLITELSKNSDHPTSTTAKDIEKLKKLESMMITDTRQVAADIMDRNIPMQKIQDGLSSRPITYRDVYNTEAIKYYGVRRTLDPEFINKSEYIDELTALEKLREQFNNVTKIGTPNGIEIDKLPTIDMGYDDYKLINKALMRDRKNWAHSWSGHDTRAKTDPFTGKLTYMISKGDSLNLAQLSDEGTPIGVMDLNNMTAMNTVLGINRVANQMFGIGFGDESLRTPGTFAKSVLTKRVLPAAGIYAAYNIMDRTLDKTMDGTPLGEGLTVFGANMYAQSRINSQTIMDMTGITSGAKYMEDLIPGIVNSPFSNAIRGFGSPMAGFSLGFKFGGAPGALVGGSVGTSVGLLTSGGPLGMYGMWNIDSSREEVIEELAGRKNIPIRKNRFWELSSNFYEGTGIDYFRPHTYATMRANPKEAMGIKDGVIDNIFGAITPDYYGLKNYYSRPYPVTAGVGSNIPVFGNMFGMIPGMPFGGGMKMHEDSYAWGDVNAGTMSDDFSKGNGIYDPMEAASMNSGGGHGMVGNSPTTHVYNPTNSEFQLSEAARDMRGIVGLRGFLLGSNITKITGERDFYSMTTMMETPGEINSVTRNYWDKSLGGMLGTNEILRRFLPYKRRDMDYFNPIPNAMSQWLPGEDYYLNFKLGDPYTKIAEGEHRLPGYGYDALRNVDYEFPMDAEIFGESLDSQMYYMLGLPEYMQPRNVKIQRAKSVANHFIDQMKQQGIASGDNIMMYNPELNMTAKADTITYDEYGNKIPVKFSPMGFNGESSLNAFLALSDMNAGKLIEVNTETGETAERMVQKDIYRFKSDVELASQAIDKAKIKMGDYINNGVQLNPGNAYSWKDRYRILGDIAPYSNEFRQAENILKQQTKLPHYSAEEIQKTLHEVQLENAQKKSKFKFTETKFLDYGHSLTEYGQERDKLVRDNYNIVERQIGALGEMVTHANTPVISRFMGTKTALEIYEEQAIYGKKVKRWENPYENFVKSHGYTMASQDSALGGASFWGATGLMAGMVVGGNPLFAAKAMSAAGALYGTVDPGNQFIPERVEQRRSIERQTDALEYARNMKLFQETGNPIYLEGANQTLTHSIMENETLTPQQLARKMGAGEKDFMVDVLNNVTSKNIDKVSRLLPQEALPTLAMVSGTKHRNMNDIVDMYENIQLPGQQSSLYNPEVNLDLVAVKEYNDILEANEAGVGFYRNMKELQEQKAKGFLNPMDSIYDNTNGINLKDIKQGINIDNTIRNALFKYSNHVIINNTDTETVTINIMVE